MEQEILSQFKILESGSSFISKNFQELQKKFPDKFIAIEDSKVIANNSDFDSLIRELEEKGKQPNLTVIEFISRSGQIILY
jgi:hypothetical protein